LILWEGPSAINGEPIVVIATGLKRKSANAKIGPDTVQVWYLPRDVAPNVAVKTGADAAVCGDCMHRPSTGGACYVVTYQAPRAVWQAYQDGSYPRWDGSKLPFIGRVVRFGAWGDPASVPAGTLAAIRTVTKRHMAYTHQWKQASARHLLDWCMASVDSAPDYLRARSAGWRTFRVRGPDEGLQVRERMCPAAEESPVSEAMDCGKCSGCDGLTRGAKRPSFAIIAHGGKASRFVPVVAPSVSMWGAAPEQHDGHVRGAW
jgi:hypothetical protein